VSVIISAPPPPSAVAKYFAFNARRVRDVVGGVIINDTTGVTVTVSASGRATFKTYSFTTSQLSTKARVRVYGYAVASYSATLYINLNNTDVYSRAFTLPTSNSLLCDAYIDVAASTSYTLKIDIANNGSYNLDITVTRVYIYVGCPLSSTTETAITSITQSNEYNVAVKGMNVSYEIGFRFRARYNRKTTATAMLKVGTSIYSISSADDGDSLQDLYSTTAGGDVTISGYVGASGDIIIIVNLYVQYVMRGNQRDSKGVSTSWCIVVKETGYVIATVRFVTFDNVSRAMSVYNVTMNGAEPAYTSASGSDVAFTFQGTSMGEMTFYVDGIEDSKSYSAIVSIAIMVIS